MTYIIPKSYLDRLGPSLMEKLNKIELLPNPILEKEDAD